ESAGRIAAQVAHDFNNLLAPLMGFPELIKQQLPARHQATEYCDLMSRAAEQMAQINQDLLTLGRRGHFQLGPVDLNVLISETLKQQRFWPDTLVVDQDLATDIPRVNG